MDNAARKRLNLLWEDWGEIRGRGLRNREKKSLHHVAMVGWQLKIRLSPFTSNIEIKILICSPYKFLIEVVVKICWSIN